MKMTMNEYANEIVAKLKERNIKAEITNVTKNNGVTLTGVMVEKDLTLIFQELQELIIV